MLKKSLIFLSILLIFSSCSKYQKLMKSSNSALKYEKAVEYYENEDYYRAMQLFDQLIPIFRGTSEAQDLYYYYAYCYYNQKDYLMASFYFKRYATTFPNSDRAEECAYMSAYCKYKDSPVPSLDQTSTQEAISELQSFINSYPDSDRIENCNNLIDQLREKLERKAFDIANLYFKMADYKAAVRSFKNVIRNFPDTDRKETIQFLIAKSYYQYAQKSVDAKKAERYQEVINAYNSFIRDYPESIYLKEITNMYKDSVEYLNV
jgi:outer membrane protein assembly factor BamD